MNAIAGFLSRSCHVLTIEELAREARALCEGEYVAAADVGRLRKPRAEPCDSGRKSLTIFRENETLLRRPCGVV